MLKAKDVMTKEVLTIGPEATLAEAIEVLIEKKISGMPVVNDSGEVVGIISEKDILNFAFDGHLHNTRVKEAMSVNIVSFPPDADINSIALAIADRHFRRVPVIENGKIVGIISRRDIIRVALKLG
jgi:CBS domain-containing protein